MITSGIEDEEKWLAAGIAGLQQNAFYMHRALDSNNMKDALKYSAQMLSELRTSKLSPHKYYELYMRAFDELRKLEMFFREETNRGCSIVELYELVQHAGNILPRLYLLCTVGSVYIKSKEAPSKDILKDLVEMCRSIQHPLRGLFLRSYLSQVSRDKLPDIGSEYEGDADTVMDAVEFVLQNFTEMNKLWVRMQHQGLAREKEKREKERSELRDLVGKNLHVLSQIEGIDLDLYKDMVLPRVLEQVVNCKDDIAQGYLMDCIIQVFPDEYHLQTLETLLGACPQFQPSVDIKTVLARLMERLSNYAALSAEVLPEFFQVEAFAKLNNAIGKVIEAQEDMPIAGAVTLYSSLLTFTLQVHPDRLDYVDQILGACIQKLSGKGKLKDNKATKQIVSLLSAPLEKYKDIDTALKLSNYPRLMEYLDDATSKEMANVLVQNILKNKTCISTAEKVEALFELMKALIRDLDEVALLTSKQQQHCFSSLGAKVQKMGDNSSSHVTRVLFCGPHFPASHNYTREYLQGYPFVQVDDVPLESVPAVIGDYEICVVKNFRMNSDVLSRAKSMKLIMQFGVGLEGVDINAAKKHGIKVARIPGGATGNAASCAEMAIYLILGLLRKQHQLKISVEQKKLGEPIGDNLQGKTVFIMGYGDIGIHLAKRLRPFDVKILATKRSWGTLAQDSSKTEAPSVENDSYDDLVDERGNHADILKFASKADIVVCCLAMNNETAGIVNNDFISVMRKGAILINVARGGLLDYHAVLNHLKSGQLGGLGIDVAWTEPFDPDDAILKFPDVIITPHVAGVTELSYRYMAKVVGDVALQLHAGEPFTGIEIVN